MRGEWSVVSESPYLAIIHHSRCQIASKKKLGVARLLHRKNIVHFYGARTLFVVKKRRRTYTKIFLTYNTCFKTLHRPRSLSVMYFRVVV